MKPITFNTACDLLNDADAVIVDNESLAFACRNEDENGYDCIEINWHTEDGLIENSFGLSDQYYINKEGELEIHEDRGTCYKITLLKRAKFK